MEWSLLTSGMGRRRLNPSRLGRDGKVCRDPNRCAVFKQAGRTELSQALLDQGRSCCGSVGRFGVSVEFSSRSRCEDVARSGGNAVPCMDCVFFVNCIAEFGGPAPILECLFSWVPQVPRRAKHVSVLGACPSAVLDLTSVTPVLVVVLPVEVCHGVGTVFIVVSERRLTGCGLIGCGVPSCWHSSVCVLWCVCVPWWYLVVVAVWPANKPIVSVLDVNYPWAYSFHSKQESSSAQVNAVKRKELLNTKGWQIMMKLGYEEAKGLGAELQGITKPNPDIVMKIRWRLGYREKSKTWSSSTSTLKADREPLTCTLWCHFTRGPTQPGYNTVVVEAELSQHEVHGRHFARHMPPMLTYRALETLRPRKRRKTGDPEAEWYHWFDIEDITIAFSHLFWEEERTWPPTVAELLD
ncbi:hypothetical protein Taro_009576 [Colocasia esculenta]|uniref:G-patch domain-containing protein n=1 Tax=Colocasia esculenta TaxID=4460 RepID=A0A843UAD5_COLES|nr:hypothetical protein [Colocasia esculenta]